MFTSGTDGGEKREKEHMPVRECPSDAQKGAKKALRKDFRVTLCYWAAALFWLVFGLVYERHSFGVHSLYMEFAFAVPLIMSAAPLVFSLAEDRIRYPGPAARSFYRFSCACFTVGSVFQGIIEIYGTESIYPLIYCIAGVVLFAASVSAFAVGAAGKRAR